jgi:hypothetical protein
MARCPFAQWHPLPRTTTAGPYTSGPFKIVHHTTEGSTAQGAFDTFSAHNFPPHFTVDSTTIYQHIDTDQAARALNNADGGVQTNRDSAIQIEVVGFAGRPKNPQTLANVARLCRWIEEQHMVQPVWPNGFPRPAIRGRDPGRHNRNANNWNNLSGHYGHCHVPENTHWDPAYTLMEVGLIMPAADDEALIAGDILDAAPIQPFSEDAAPLHIESVPALSLGERVPDRSEGSAVGPFRGLIPRSSPNLVRNNNPNIVFANDEGNNDDRYMTRRLQEKTDILAELVMREWPGVRLRVTDAWDEGEGHSSTSRHYEGRAVDITTFPRDRSKLGRLGSLAVEAGYDWVFYEDPQHIHASVAREEDAHELLASNGFDTHLVMAEESQQDILSQLMDYVTKLQQEEQQMESPESELPPEYQKRLDEIGSAISRLEAAIVLLSPLFKL